MQIFKKRFGFLLFGFLAMTPTGKLLGQTQLPSVDSGYICQAAKKCDGNGCSNGKIQPEFTWPLIKCKNCIGISNDALWNNPCPKCGRTRKVKDPNFKPPKLVNCNKCQGTGVLYYGPKFQVADQDFPRTKRWDDAVNICTSLGANWRLPTLDELRGMRSLLFVNGKGRLTGSFYWSSEVYDNDPNNKSMVFHLGWNHANQTSKYDWCQTRAVRTLLR